MKDKEQENIIRDKKEKKKTFIPVMKTVLSLICIAVIGLFVYDSLTDKRPRDVDPFEYLEVSFSGTTGKGVLNMSLKDTGDMPLTVEDFSAEKSEDLYEGETVNIIFTGRSAEYNYLNSKKKYKVRGLTTCITDISAAEGNVLGAILGISDKKIEETGTQADFSVLTAYIPKRMYLCFEDENENSIYIIYEGTFENSRNQVERTFMAAVLEDVVIIDGNVEFSSCMSYGDMLNVIGGQGRETSFGLVTGFQSLEDADKQIRKDHSGENVLTKELDAGFDNGL